MSQPESMSQPETAPHVPSVSRAKVWRRRIFKVGCLLLIVVGIGCWVTLSRFKKDDLKHATFQKDGESIKAMLTLYGKAYRHVEDRPESLRPYYHADFLAINRGEIELAPAESLGDAKLARFVSQGNSAWGYEQVVLEAVNYFRQIDHVDLAKFKIDLIEDLIPGRKAVLTVKHVLNGTLVDGQQFEDRVFYRWTLENVSPPDELRDWKITNQQLVAGERTFGTREAFELQTLESIGINYRHRRNPILDKTKLDTKIRFSVVEHAGGGLAANDYDGDGDIDILFLDGVESRLFQNQSPESSLSQSRNPVQFRDVTEEVGLGGIGQAHSGLFVDFDNDGDRDLFVACYLTGSRFFRNEAGKFVDQSEQVGLGFVGTSTSCCVLDYDRDGFLDLYVGMFGNAFEATPDIPFFATNGQKNRLFRNVGGQRFEDVSQAAGVDSNGWSLAVTAGDFDHDGFPDLAVANDFGRKVLYRNNQDGTFTDVAKAAGVLDFSGGMGISFCDLNGDAFPDLITANIESGTRWFGEEATLWQYMRNTIRDGFIWQDWGSLNELYRLVGADWKQLGKQIGEGNSVFLNRGDGTFREWKDCNANRAGWAWSINAFDYDLDGDLDLYCSNGWVTSKLKDDL